MLKPPNVVVVVVVVVVLSEPPLFLPLVKPLTVFAGCIPLTVLLFLHVLVGWALGRTSCWTSIGITMTSLR